MLPLPLHARTVRVLPVQEGFYNLWNWFDDKTWYPLGRVIGGTVYPVSFVNAASQQPCYLVLPDHTPSRSWSGALKL